MKFYLLGLPWLLVAGCQKKDPTPADPAAQLPPATQTGAKTFGCLVNGQPWTPNGNNGTPNLVVSYDPSYLGGALQVRAYRYVGPQQDVLQGIVFGASDVKRPATHAFSLQGGNGANYIDNAAPSPCRYYGEYPSLTEVV